MTDSVYYLTKYTIWQPRKKQEKTGSYVTKSLTGMHQVIREGKYTLSATTMKCDPSVDWPFGVFAEVIASKSRKEGAR